VIARHLNVGAFVLFFVCLLVSSHAFASIKGVRSMVSSAEELDILVDINPVEFDRQLESDSTYSYFRTIQVAVPHGAQVQLLSAEGISLVPLGDEADHLPRLSAILHPLVEISRPILVRHQRLAALRLFPITGVDYFRQVRIRLTFRGAQKGDPGTFSDPRFHHIFKAAVVNYDAMRHWPVPVTRASRVLPDPGPLAVAHEWYKIKINQTGLCRVTGQDLENQGLLLADISIDSIHLFCGGGLSLPVQNDISRPQFREVSCLVVDDGDGLFESGDAIIFYAESVDRWLHEPNGDAEYVHHPYTHLNTYWLATSGNFDSPGLRMISIDVSPIGVYDTLITSFTQRLHLEQDNMLRKLNAGDIEDYFNWYWSNEEHLNISVNTPGRVSGENADIRLVGLTGGGADSGFIDLTVNDISASSKSCSKTGCTYQTDYMNDGFNDFRLTLYPQYVVTPNGVLLYSLPYFDYLEVEYKSHLIPQGDLLEVVLGPSSDRARFEVVDEFADEPTLFSLNDPANPAILTGAERTSGVLALELDLLPVGSNRILVTPLSAAHRPLEIELASPLDLRNVGGQTDLVVITPSIFVDHIADWVDINSERGISTAVVSVEDIMDNFGWGLYGPTAIRDFLKFAYENYPSPAPSAVLLVGDAVHDYRDVLQTGQPNYVPIYLHPFDRSASDDNFVYFGQYGLLDSDTSYHADARGYDMLVARWPVSSSAEIRDITAKIESYQSASNLGIWRNRITLVADDEYHHATPNTDELYHVRDVEELDRSHIPRLFSRNKIYLWDYPSVGRKKPAVNTAIVESINDGTLLINYVGHGSPDVWSDEHVLHRITDLLRMTNGDRLPLFFVASCAIGFFDDPAREGMAEELLSLPNAGAIGTISATRLVYATANAHFNRKAFDILLTHDSLGMGEALFVAKLQKQYLNEWPSPVVSDRTYSYFGDPFLRLGIPVLSVEFDDFPDSLVALKPDTITGHVVDDNGIPQPYDGSLEIRIFDSDRSRTYKEVTYELPGSPIFRGSASIIGGAFSFIFMPPLDIKYGGNSARVQVYARFDEIDGAGLLDSLQISSQVAQIADSVGPVIDFAIGGRNEFESGDPVTSGEQLQIVLSDPSGINLSTGLGHGISLTVDDESENAVNLNRLFEYDQDDYTVGRLSWPISGLGQGAHAFKIKAWDNANNSSVVSFEAEIVGPNQLAIRDLLNYPNPMQDSTRFSLVLTGPTRQLTLEIFTLSGKKIWSFSHGQSLPAGHFDDITWYGRDSVTFDRVATGVYIFKAVAFSSTGGDRAEAFGKVVVIN